MRNVKKIFAGLFIIVLSEKSFSCSILHSQVFEPDASNYIEHSGNETSPPTPRVENIKVTRGRDESGSTCDDAGSIQLTVGIPDNSEYKISEIGFRFRLKEGASADTVFHEDYLFTSGRTEDNKKTVLRFSWLDGHPKNQKPLDLYVEVSSVDNHKRESSPLLFRITAPVGKPKTITERVKSMFWWLKMF